MRLRRFQPMPHGADGVMSIHRSIARIIGLSHWIVSDAIMAVGLKFWR